MCYTECCSVTGLLLHLVCQTPDGVSAVLMLPAVAASCRPVHALLEHALPTFH